jgi:TRAP-type C4-dicarboxylate transport system substrate-binding protein
MDWWASEVERRSGGRIQFERFYGGALLDATSMRDGVAANQAEVGNFSPGYHPGDFPLTEGLFTVPFTTTSPAAAMDAIQALYRKTEEAQAEYHNQGLELIKPIAAAEGALGTKVPVSTLDDLKGLNIRGYEGGGINTGLRAVGAQPVDLSVAELYESLQRGVIDGFAALIVDAGVQLSLHEVTDYWVQAGFGVAASAVIAANKEWYDSLPDDIKTIMAEVADEMTPHYLQFLEDAETKACQTLKDAGITVTALPEAEQQRWRDLIADTQMELFEKQAAGKIDDPAAYFAEFKALVQEAEAKYPEETGIGRCVG